MILTLVPTYPSGVSVEDATETIILEMVPALRGPIGPTGYGLLGVTALADQATVTVNLADPVGVYTVTLAASRNLTFTGGTAELDRKRFILEVTQGTGGNKTLTPDATVSFGADLTSIDLSISAGVTDALGFIYRHATGKCHLLAVNHGA